MRRLALAAMVALLAGPLLANAREDGEAKLASLAEAIVPALAAAMPQVEGMVCGPDTPDPSPTNRLLLPNWRGLCRWQGGEARVVLVLSPSLAESHRQDLAALAEAPPVGMLFHPAEAPRALATADRIEAAPSPSLAALAEATGPGAEAAMNRLAEALAGMGTATLEEMPEVPAQAAALVAHRQLLTAQRADLDAVLTAAGGATTVPLPPEEDYPDHLFFGAQPLVQSDLVEAGVAMTATLTTSSFALENAASEGLMALRKGEMGPRGVLNDRGRVQVHLQETSLTAVIDGRAMLMLYVPEVAPGTDPLAAMEAVLARIAATDFSGY
ncbi:hypothetical protein LHP98_06750 [Rhodobacter sp. Har01]|uniref:hypothetical protein n=1 Tax=Rhodobacter sp. Har01 TaxID=2883999 RepID=UPI001D098184|nr:hypothetical protein [Rhodobacter sp. Har01]MCB6177829.1 hypothetical protein [Rhodobacter sp. Har01]